MVELPPQIQCARYFCQHYFIVLPCTSSSGLYCPDTHEASVGSCPLVFPVGQLCLDQYPLVHSPHPKIHHKVNIDGISISSKNCLCLADL